MTIITIPNKSLIRWLPFGQRTDPVAICHDPSLARVDSSRILMTYLACASGDVSRICACYLDEECVADASSNVILSAGFESSRESLSLYQDGPDILGICNQTSEVASFRFDHRPDTSLKLFQSNPRCPLILFTLNGSLMGMSKSLMNFHLLHEDQHGYVCHMLPEERSSMNILPGVASGLTKSGDGWVFFYFSNLTQDDDDDEIGVFMVRLKFNRSFSFEFSKRPVFAIPKLDNLGTPIRHGEGWALPFDDGSGVCKIALIADEEIK